MKNISILGSTGSIGTQALEVVRQNPNLFNIVALTGNNNIELLEKQVYEFKPSYVAVYNEKKAIDLKKRLSHKNTKVLSGLEGLIEVCTLDKTDLVLTSVVGTIGLLPTLNAIRKGKNIALANKETLVTAGEIIMSEAKKHNVSIIPVDSEHSAIFQCLQGSEKTKIKKIILTASGGPFRGMKKEDLVDIDSKSALKHPNWSMGNKISIDSATLMNKGLEVIEAKWLFNLDIHEIDVIVHPQSIIHSMVEFIDGSVLAQLGLPDMRIPIQYSFTYPKRIEFLNESLDLIKIKELTFEKPDKDTFPCLSLAYEALKIGGTMPTVLNAANEELVLQFISNKIGFYDIPRRIEKAMELHTLIEQPNIDDLLEVDKDTRRFINNNF